MPPPCVTFRLAVAPLRGPGRSPVLPFACCVGSLLSVGRCGRCSCWCRPPPPPPEQSSGRPCDSELLLLLLLWWWWWLFLLLLPLFLWLLWLLLWLLLWWWWLFLLLLLWLLWLLFKVLLLLLSLYADLCRRRDRAQARGRPNAASRNKYKDKPRSPSNVKIQKSCCVGAALHCVLACTGKKEIVRQSVKNKKVLRTRKRKSNSDLHTTGYLTLKPK